MVPVRQARAGENVGQRASWVRTVLEDGEEPRRVNSAKSHHASVAAALRLAIVAYEQTDEVAEIATAAMPKTAPKKPSALNSDKKGEVGKRKRESPSWAKEAAAHYVEKPAVQSQ